MGQIVNQAVQTGLDFGLLAHLGQVINLMLTILVHRYGRDRSNLRLTNCIGLGQVIGSIFGDLTSNIRTCDVP